MKETTDAIRYFTQSRQSGVLPLFEICALTHAYPNGCMALNSMDLTIFQGDRIALVGHNGAGKTTLIKHLNGLLRPLTGEVRYRGLALEGAHLQAARLEIGMLFQDPDDQLFCNTLDEDISFGPGNQGLNPAEVEERTVDSLRQMHLDQYRYKAPHLLSYGQKKRAAFATLLSMNPSVLILDEPTANLDPKQEKFFTDLLNDFSGTIICISHDLPFLFGLCTRAVVLDRGEIHHDFSMTDLISHSVYLREHGLDFSFRLSCCQNPGSNHSGHPGHFLDSGKMSDSSRNDFPNLPHPTEPALIRMRDYAFRYADGTWGIRDMTFSIKKGDRIAIIGENGAGKSTLVSCLAGIVAGTGAYDFNENPVTLKNRQHLWRQIGLAFQDPADQLFCPSCLEEITFGLKRLGLSVASIQQRVAEALEMVQLSSFGNRAPQHLSAGERKRVALAAVLAMRPQVLVLDEPTANLDPQSVAFFCNMLQGLDVTQILITHDMGIASLLCNRILVMHQGRLIRDYSLAQFLSDEHLISINGLDYTYKNAYCQEIRRLQEASADCHPIL
jgi:energy-coupling factor transporter ATP-binding protein EcfA2